MRPLPSAAAVVVDSGSRIRQQRRHRRRPPPPAAPTACGSASALGTCLLALIVNTAGESSALATAFLADGGGSGSRSPACFLHAAAAGGARDRDGGGSGRRRSACGAGLLGATARRRGCNDSRGESAGHRSRLATAAAAWGRESEGEVLPVRAGRGVAAAAHGRGSRWEQGGKGRAAGGGGSLYMLKTGGGGGGIKAAGKMEAAATASVGDAREALGATAAAPADLQDLAKLKLAELKLLYRESGGKPGSLRKAELVQRLSESRQIGTVTGSPGTLVVEEAAPAAVLAAAPEHPSPTVLESSPNGGAAAAPVAAVAGRGGGAETSAASSLFSVLSGGGAVADPAPPVLESQPKAGTENAAAGATPLPGKGGADSSAAGSLFSVLSGSGAGAEADNPAGRAPHESGPVVPATATEWSHESPPATLDVLSSGPSAVVAAARARGAAAAAESSRLAAGGRMRARAEAQRHTEAMRTRATAAAASTSSSINNNGLSSQQQPQQQPAAGRYYPRDSGGHVETTRAMTNGARGAGGLRSVNHHNGITAPGAAAVAAVAAAEAKVAPGSSSSSGISRDRSGSGGGGGGGGAYSVIVDSPVARRSGQRQRRLPAVPNPWSRGGVGGDAEGMPLEGDVVDAFLASTMMEPSDEREASGDPLFDRESRFGVFPAGAPMQLTFLGTASCIPSTSRGVSCTVLRNEGDLWLFDVGEGTQIQIQKSSLKPTRITKIFITHAHGDHSFGLPGLLCLMGTNFDRADGRRVEIYGPTGLRAYLRAAVQFTYSKAVVPYVVHELTDVPYLHGDHFGEPEPIHVNIARDVRYGEQHGGRNFFPDKNGHYELFQDDKVTVRAAPMKHGVPCVGYTVEEADRPGRLKVEELNPILEEHKQAICNTTGRKDVGWMLGWIKSTKRGETITLPGTDVTLDSADYVGASVKGRKVVILGDTCDAASIVPLAMGADVVVHEATNTMLPPLDQGKTYADVEAEAIKHGHSTPMMAAAFAQRVGAKTLILNHFSARYRGDPSDASVAAMLRIERQAARAGGLERHQVVASWDLLEMPVVDADQWEANRATAREADAAFDGELLRRAQQWQQQQQEEVEGAGRSPSVSGTAATSSPVLSHEHEHSRDFLRDAAASGGGAASPRGSVAAASGPSNGGGDGGGGESSMMLRGHGGETAIEGGSAASGPGDDGSISRGDRETATVDGSGAAPAKTGLVGIMFDAVA